MKRVTFFILIETLLSKVDGSQKVACYRTQNLKVIYLKDNYVGWTGNG